MRRRWLWLAVVVVTIATLVAGINWHSSSARSPLSEVNYSPNSSPAAAPTVNSKRLLDDLKALSFKRFDESDRSRARSYIVKALRDAGWTPRTHAFPASRGRAPSNGINIYAERPGTDPNAGTVLLGAHYDTVQIAPGADDNATAVATVLETARLLSQQSTAHTLQVVLFDLEEEGLLGSKAFVEQIVKPDGFRGAVIMDMIGFTCHTDGCQSYPPLPITPPSKQGDFLAAIGDQNHLSLLSSFSQASSSRLPPVLALPVPTVGDSTPDLVRSDHASFWRKGLGAVLVTDTANFRNPNYHKPSDTLETIDQTFFLGAAQVVVNATTALLQG